MRGTEVVTQNNIGTRYEKAGIGRDGTGSSSITTEYERKMWRINRSLGIPPKYNMDVDIQYTDELSAGYGRVYSQTILASPTIVSLCPGQVTMLPNFGSDKKDNIMNTLKEAAGDNTAIIQKLTNETDDGWTAKLFAFEQDTAGYAKHLNVLCRASAILMGVGDINMPNTGIKLKNFDFAYWTLRNSYVDTKDSKLRSIFTDFFEAAKTSTAGAIDDTNYVHFFVNNQETSISESIQTSTTSAPILENAAATLGDLSAKLNYYLGGKGSGIIPSSAKSEMASIVSTLVGDDNTWATIGNALLNGGQLVFPQMINGATYSKDIRLSFDFISPYGDPLSIFLNCNVPALHLLAMSLPKQVTDNMYTFPFVVRVYQQGNFSSDLAIITDVSVNRGGDDGTCWTEDGLSTAWNVSMTITPLYTTLMMTSSDHPGRFMKNESLIEYLGNLCGFDIVVQNLQVKLNLFADFVHNWIRDIPSSAGRVVGDRIANFIGGLFKLT